ncbi:MAG: SprA-related [Desulfobulbaceae bacterium]|nr:MAG: SprA-related [Desulfobulbaceae bacterium]
MLNFSALNTAAYGVQAYQQTSLTATGGQKKATPPPHPLSAAPAGQSEDKVSLSKEGKELSAAQETSRSSEQENKQETDPSQSESKGSDQLSLDETELRQVQQLRSRDTEVRTHEQAHLAAAGQYAAGGPSFSYQTGPDGKRYAVGGSVPIDIGEESTSAATIQKMRTVKRAALAPANPSAADRQIAAQAGMSEMKAIQELQVSQQAETIVSPAQPDKKEEDIPSDPSGPSPQNVVEQSPATPESSAATRKLTADAYQAMASLA